MASSEMIAFCKEKFIAQYKDFFPSAELDEEKIVIQESPATITVRHGAFEHVWNQFKGARIICSALPIRGIRFDTPMSSQEYFLVEINTYTGDEVSGRQYPHYEFLNWLHLLPYI